MAHAAEVGEDSIQEICRAEALMQASRESRGVLSLLRGRLEKLVSEMPEAHPEADHPHCRAPWAGSEVLAAGQKGKRLSMDIPKEGNMMLQSGLCPFLCFQGPILVPWATRAPTLPLS